MEINEKKGFIHHAIGLCISIVAIIVFCNIEKNILLIGLLCGGCLAYSLYLNNEKGLEKSLLKTLLIYCIVFAAFLLLIYFNYGQIEMQYLLNAFFASFLVLPGVYCAFRVVSFLIEILP